MRFNFSWMKQASASGKMQPTYSDIIALLDLKNSYFLQN